MPRIKKMYLRYHKLYKQRSRLLVRRLRFYLFKIFIYRIDLFDYERHLIFQFFDLALHLFYKTTTAFRGYAEETDVVFVCLQFIFMRSYILISFHVRRTVCPFRVLRLSYRSDCCGTTAFYGQSGLLSNGRTDCLPLRDILYRFYLFP